MATELTPGTAGFGTAVTASAADATGNYVRPQGRDIALRITNGSASSIDVTLDDPTSVAPEGAAIGAGYPDVVFAVAAGASRWIILNRARRARFSDPATGRVNWSYSLATTVTVEAVAL